MKTDKNKIKLLLSLFGVFFKIGAFTFGGGYAMIPLIQKEVAQKRKWITDEEILEIVAIAESTPGPIAINAATFVGYNTAGFSGAFSATLGVVLPSFAVISLITAVLKEFQNIQAVKYAFFGIRAGVLALLIKALASMYKKTEKDVVSYIVMAAALVLTAALNVNVIIIIIGCAVFGLVSSLIIGRQTE